MPTYFQRPENALKRANGNEIFFSVCPSFTSAGATCWTRNAWDIIPCSCKLCDDLAIGVFVVYVFEYESFCEDVMKIKPPKFRFFEMSPVRILSNSVIFTLNHITMTRLCSGFNWVRRTSYHSVLFILNENVILFMNVI